MKHNPERRVAQISGIITIIAIFAIFAPNIFGMDGFEGGFAISFFSFFIAVSGIITFLIFIGRARSLDRVFLGENLLAHWTYDPEEWKKYTETEYKTERREKWHLFYLVAGIALIIGIIFLIVDNEAGLIVFLVMLGLIALIAFVAWFTSWSNYRRNKKKPGEIYISGDAIYLNGQYHTWKGMGSKLRSVLLSEKDGQQQLAFTYSFPARTGIEEYTVRLPVPAGQEKTAEEIAVKFQKYL